MSKEDNTTKDKEEPKIKHFLDELNETKDIKNIDFTNGGQKKTIQESKDSYVFYPDKPDNALHKYLFTMKQEGQYYNPCRESELMSFKCLERNQDDKYRCQQFFDAYKECKKFWAQKRKQGGNDWRR
ncbi:hypothetical protein ACO0OL_003471 [Hanseniaspora opuntiae]|jgi:cytochrome c oxidase assembly protein subunit 23|uniref:Cytochrome c oxidase-assembly factor COX23, mitochondrial n=1 Tax=Hanseniaspora opuntiae TaxID=211096 RepID=A0A1E5RMX0_9ASCO|nr:Cytochrome c oxidase-assembly factor COX23, mitochondrial [Hanseniaspora opuntiae]